MVFVMSPEVEAKLVALEEFELKLPKKELFGSGYGFRDAFIGMGEVELRKIEKEMLRYGDLKKDEEREGPGLSYLLGMVETYGGKILVSVAGDTEYRLRVRYEEEDIRNAIAGLHEQIAEEDTSGGDKVMVAERIKGLQWQMGFLKKKLATMKGKERINH